MPHPIRLSVLLAALCMLLFACAVPHKDSAVNIPPAGGQTYRQLHLPDAQSETMIAAWIPYFTVESLLSSPDAARCRETVTEYLRTLRDIGINTVFVHVSPFGESSYPSVYYPPQPEANGHDAMQIFTDACRTLDISLHAWINPLRLQTDEIMQAQTGDAALSVWYRDEKQRAGAFSAWDGRQYLNPAAESTRKLLTGVITELITAYHPDGIHIDDYFYPTTDPSFDAADFAASGAGDLAAWRREQITELMRTMYKAVHCADEDAIFSVSPQGNFAENYDSLYADVARWAADGGCCDLIIPQLYYGYENESHPFAETLAAWSTLPRADHVEIAAGLAVYKVGQNDPYAGRGAAEWCTQSGMPARQAADALRMPAVSGVAFYNSDALIQLGTDETNALLEVLRGQ